MKNEKETIIRTNSVSPKRYLWYLLILAGVAIFGLYLLYSMNSYQSETNPRTMQELFVRAFRSDAALPFLALIIPVTAVIAYFIVRACSKLEVVVTDQRVYGRLFFGATFDLPLNSIQQVKKSSSTTLLISSKYGDVKLRLLDNCNEIYEAMTGKPVPAISYSQVKKQERMKELKSFSDEALTTRIGTMQAAARIAYVFLILLAIGCVIFAAIPCIEYGFEYGMTIAPAYLLLFLFVVMIMGYPLYYIHTRKKDAFDEIARRSSSSKEMTRLHDMLRKKRNRAMKVLISIIIITPIIIGCVVTVLVGGDSSFDSDKTVACSYCYREFKGSSDNGKNISRTNLCINCYENMKDMEDALDDFE